MRKMLACMLIILFSFLMLLPYAVRAEEVSPPVEVYNIKMFADDMVLNSPINDYYYWLEIRPGIVLNNVLIDIWYSCSDTIIKEISSPYRKRERKTFSQQPYSTGRGLSGTAYGCCSA